MTNLTRFTPEEIAAIRRAFCFYSGASERWRKLAGAGATDAQLMEFIRREMGQGGSSGPAPMVPVACHNSPPRIWPNEYNYFTAAKPTLAGRDLLSIAREMFAVDTPQPAGQPRLL
jgi:hypothetical protein